MSVKEIIQQTKLQKYANNNLLLNVVSRINSVKTALCLKERGDEQPVVAPTDDIYNIFSSTTKSWNYTKQY